jgi:PAS domain-containing protein
MGQRLLRSFEAWACLLLGVVLVLLALALRFERLGVVVTQRLAVAALSIFVLSGLHQVWFVGAASPVDVSAVATTSIWLLPLTVWMFACLPRAGAATAALALAAMAAAFPWWSAAPADPGLRPLALHVLLAHGALCVLLYGLARQVQRLASVGGATALAAQADTPDVQSVEQFVSRREAGLRRLLRQSELAQHMAAQREAELRTMLDAFPGVVLRVESSGTISYCNERAAALLGLDRSRAGRPARPVAAG